MKQINSCLLFVLLSSFNLLAKAQFDAEKYDKECYSSLDRSISRSFFVRLLTTMS